MAKKAVVTDNINYTKKAVSKTRQPYTITCMNLLSTACK